MAKRRRKKPPSRRRPRGPRGPREPQEFLLLEYEITYEPLDDPVQDRLPEVVQERIRQLHGLSQSRPREAVPELLALIETYPDVRVLYNYLSVAYSALGQYEKAEEVIRENLRRHPDYLFARLNYAESCLRRGRLDEVAEVLDHKFDLKLLYPRRTKFHISEFVAFACIVGSYFAARGELEIAERYYQTLSEVDPDHPLTAQLRSQIDRAQAVREIRRARDGFRDLLKWGRRPKPDPGP